MLTGIVKTLEEITGTKGIRRMYILDKDTGQYAYTEEHARLANRGDRIVLHPVNDGLYRYKYFLLRPLPTEGTRAISEFAKQPDLVCYFLESWLKGVREEKDDNLEPSDAEKKAGDLESLLCMLEKVKRDGDHHEELLPVTVEDIRTALRSAFTFTLAGDLRRIATVDGCQLRLREREMSRWKKAKGLVTGDVNKNDLKCPICNDPCHGLKSLNIRAGVWFHTACMEAATAHCATRECCDGVLDYFVERRGKEAEGSAR